MQRRWTVGGALALLLSVTALASAQDAGAPATPAPPATTIIVLPPPPPAATAASPAGTAGDAPAAPPAVARPMSEQPPTYRPGPARARARKAITRPILGPVATYPGFRMLDGGGSRVFVSVNHSVDVTEHKAEGRVTYRLRGVAAPVRTNRLPLLTNFFPTPVGRVQLVEQGSDVDVVIDLRMPSTSQHRVVKQNGGILLQIDFPKPVGLPAAAAPAAAPPSAKRTQNSTTIRGGSTD